MKTKTVWEEATTEDQDFWVWKGTRQGVFDSDGDVRWVNVLGVELHDMEFDTTGKLIGDE